MKMAGSRVAAILAGAVLAVSLAVSLGASRAAGAVEIESPLDLPIEELQATISKATKCKWERRDYKIRCYVSESPIRLDWVDLVLSRDGSLDQIELTALRAPDEIGIASGRWRAKDRQAAVVAAVVALFPEWKDARSWMRNALRQSLDEGFMTSIRVGDTSILVSRHTYADLDGDWAGVVLTRKKIRPYFDSDSN